MRSIQGRLWLQIICIHYFQHKNELVLAISVIFVLLGVIVASCRCVACVSNNDGVRGSFSYHSKREPICAPLFQLSRSNIGNLVFHCVQYQNDVTILKVRKEKILKGFIFGVEWCHITS